MALTLRLVDRSRYETAREHCERDRYLTYHAGDHGYGWQKRAVSIPATTGGLVHGPIAEILQWCKTHNGEFPPDEVIYTAIQSGVSQYHKIVETRGLSLVVDDAELIHRTKEQTTLLEGLVWAFCRVRLQSFLEEYEIIDVETEDVSVIGCTCGLGDLIGRAEEHDARGCGGIGWMTRADVVSRRRLPPHTYRYDEFKTTSDATMNWEAQWKYRLQLKMGVLGRERELGVMIDTVAIHALIKGKNQSEWNPEEGKASGPKYQNSPLVYGYRLPANYPLTPEQWAPKKKYFDEVTGKNKMLGRDWQRTGLWTMSEDLWKANGSLSPLDYWTRWIAPTGLLSESYREIGPFTRDQWKLDSAIRQVVGEERRWDDALWKLYEMTEAGHAWGSPEFMALLDELVPQTSGAACHSYFGDECPHLKLCERWDGWETPELIGYIPRRPHHEPERLQAIERGLLPPDEGGAEEASE